MELMILWIWNNAWAVPAICDAVALSCAVGCVSLLRVPASSQAQPAEPNNAELTADVSSPEPAAPTVSTDQPVRSSKRHAAAHPSRISEEMLKPLPVSRKVSRALEALDEWESTYRPSGRGLSELSRLAARREHRVKAVKGSQ